jgi:hypothetical protein
VFLCKKNYNKYLFNCFFYTVQAQQIPPKLTQWHTGQEQETNHQHQSWGTLDYASEKNNAVSINSIYFTQLRQNQNNTELWSDSFGSQ